MSYKNPEAKFKFCPETKNTTILELISFFCSLAGSVFFKDFFDGLSTDYLVYESEKVSSDFGIIEYNNGF